MYTTGAKNCARTFRISTLRCNMPCAGDYEMVGGSRRWGQGSRCAYDFHSGKSNVTSSVGGTGAVGGRFFSPRYPQNYPPSTSCQYTFYGRRNERVRVMFDNVQLEYIDGRWSNRCFLFFAFLFVANVCQFDLGIAKSGTRRWSFYDFLQALLLHVNKLNLLCEKLSL